MKNCNYCKRYNECLYRKKLKEIISSFFSVHKYILEEKNNNTNKAISISNHLAEYCFFMKISGEIK